MNLVQLHRALLDIEQQSFGLNVPHGDPTVTELQQAIAALLADTSEHDDIIHAGCIELLAVSHISRYELEMQCACFDMVPDDITDGQLEDIAQRIDEDDDLWDAWQWAKDKAAMAVLAKKAT